MVRDIALDNPAHREDEDEFNRWPFSKRLAETIAGFEALQGAPVLGLFGSWGSGKSTVLNFVRAALEKDHADRITVFSFNPWLFNDTDTLLAEFFGRLARRIDAELDKSGKRVGMLMARYGGVLSAVPIVGGGIGKGVEALGKDLASDSTEERRDRLTAAMREADKKVVVLIDDLDRLDRDEIMTMLKVVRLSANFPNLVYLLAFDDQRVGRVAGQAYGEDTDGRQFLEKIVQYPFSLPAVSPDRLAAYVLRHAQRACGAAEVYVDNQTWTEFRRICKDILLVWLNTPRQAIRYANALRFALPMLKGEVDPFDQMLIEATRILFPQLYAVLRDQRNFSHTGNEEILNRVESAYPNISVNEKTAAEQLVKELLRWERSSDKPISDSRYHGRYFSYAVAPDDISDRELNELLELARTGEQDAVDRAVRTLADTRLAVLAERLSRPIVLTNLDLKRANRLAIALGQIGDLLPADVAIDEQDLASTVGFVVATLASHLMEVREHQQNHVAASVLERATPLPFAVVIYRELGRVAHLYREERRTDFEHDWTKLRQIISERIKGDAQREPPYNAYVPKDAWHLLQFWRDTAPAEENAWLEKRLNEHPREVTPFLSLFSEPQITYQYIAELAPPAVFAEALERHWGARLQDPSQSSAEIRRAREFLEAYATRLRGT